MSRFLKRQKLTRETPMVCARCIKQLEYLDELKLPDGRHYMLYTCRHCELSYIILQLDHLVELQHLLQAMNVDLGEGTQGARGSRTT